MTEHHESAKQLIDIASLATVIGTLSDMLPAVAALFSIVWSAIRIWETDTVKGWTGRQDQGE
jgi:hypothetical protein